MRRRGEITVFLAMILLSMCALLCGIAESVRTAGARQFLRTAVNASADSLMAQYHRGLWETYRILGLEHRGESGGGNGRFSHPLFRSGELVSHGTE